MVFNIGKAFKKGGFLNGNDFARGDHGGVSILYVGEKGGWEGRRSAVRFIRSSLGLHEYPLASENTNEKLALIIRMYVVIFFFPPFLRKGRKGKLLLLFSSHRTQKPGLMKKPRCFNLSR